MFVICVSVTSLISKIVADCLPINESIKDRKPQAANLLLQEKTI